MRNKIDWGNFKAGDIIIDLGGNKCKVLGKMDQVFARSAWYNFDTFSEMKSVSDAKKDNWRFIQDDGKVPMTVEEIETMMGHRVRITK